MLKFSEFFEFSRENSYFERIRMVRMVRMVRSLADRTFQLWFEPGDVDLLRPGLEGRLLEVPRRRAQRGEHELEDSGFEPLYARRAGRNCESCVVDRRLALPKDTIE